MIEAIKQALADRAIHRGTTILEVERWLSALIEYYEAADGYIASGGLNWTKQSERVAAARKKLEG